MAGYVRAKIRAAKKNPKALQNRRSIDRSKPKYIGKKGRAKFPLKHPEYRATFQSSKAKSWVKEVQAVRAAHGCSLGEAMKIASQARKSGARANPYSLDNRRAIDRTKPQYIGKSGRPKYPYKHPEYRKSVRSSKAQAWIELVKQTKRAHGCSLKDAMIIAARSRQK